METQHSAAKIVVGVDGSPSSQAALRWAMRYAGLVGGKVEAVTAWEVPGEASWSAPAVDATFDEEDAQRRLVDEVRTVLGEEGASLVRERIVHGHPVEVLVLSLIQLPPCAPRLRQPAGRPPRPVPGDDRPAGRARRVSSHPLDSGSAGRTRPALLRFGS